jgi:predicted RNA-binding Zn ribbon-like protein
MLRRLAGHPALDFTNTVDPREGDGRVEYLNAFSDLIEWAYQGGVLDARARRRILRAARQRPALAARGFTRAVELREALYAIFSALASGRRLPPPAVRTLVAAYRDALAHARLTRGPSSFHWRLDPEIDFVRWQIAQEAVVLLESDRIGRVKRCPGSGDCGWVFFDSSKNASRHWCSMEGCGNRAKARRFVGRHRGRTHRRRASRRGGRVSVNR